jgi:hypothetical protein
VRESLHSVAGRIRLGKRGVGLEVVEKEGVKDRIGEDGVLSLSWLLFAVSLCKWYLFKVFMWALLCWKCRICMIELMGPKGCLCSARCRVKP